MSALTGKVAIVTGAGSGIGRASALRFAAEGAKLVLGDKTEAVHETAQMVKDAGGSATALQIDAEVLPKIDELQGGTNRIAALQAGVVGDPVQVQQQSAYRIG
jgi:NAD(P)-dependent dehydrogenase (short-subunit alcohol dehydrogenase family)